MKTSSSVENIFKAQIPMLAEIQNIGKDSKGYGYNYTSLDKLLEYIKPILSKYDLAIFQTTTSKDDGRIGVTTRLIHVSGEWIESEMVAPLAPLAKMNEYQVAGSIITYFRRYAISAIVGIASDDDMDAQSPQKQNQNSGKASNSQSDKNANGVSFKQIGFFKSKIGEAQKAKNQQMIDELHKANISGDTIDNINFNQVATIKNILGLNE